MRITVLGAAGATGRLVVEQALGAGHQVNALVRRADQLEISSDHLDVAVGDATVADDLESCFRAADVVISALGVGIVRHTRLMTHASAAIVEAAARTGVRRVVVLSAFGVGDSAGRAGLLHRVVIKTLMKGTFSDKAEGEAILRASDLQWTLAYPVTMSHGPFTGAIKSGSSLHVSIASRVSRADVAAFLIAEAVSPSWTGQTVTLAD